jgi:hypothetical protein
MNTGEHRCVVYLPTHAAGKKKRSFRFVLIYQKKKTKKDFFRRVRPVFLVRNEYIIFTKKH